MNIMHFFIGVMLLVQFSIYAQSAAQVTLSIRLFPIQVIEVDLINTQTLHITNDEDTPNDLNQISQQLSTFSTSQYALTVDSVKTNAFEELRASSATTLPKYRSTNRIIDIERYDDETDSDDLHVIYSMEAI